IKFLLLNKIKLNINLLKKLKKNINLKKKRFLKKRKSFLLPFFFSYSNNIDNIKIKKDFPLEFKKSIKVLPRRKKKIIVKIRKFLKERIKEKKAKRENRIELKKRLANLIKKKRKKRNISFLMRQERDKNKRNKKLDILNNIKRNKKEVLPSFIDRKRFVSLV